MIYTQLMEYTSLEGSPRIPGNDISVFLLVCLNDGSGSFRFLMVVDQRISLVPAELACHTFWQLAGRIRCLWANCEYKSIRLPPAHLSL
jgi:hypothetical protein